MAHKKNGKVKQDIGLAILTSSAVFGAWSAWNSSLFTVSTFVDTQKKYNDAKLAMNLGLLTSAGIGIGVYLVYNKKATVASLAAVLTGVALYIAYYLKLNQNVPSFTAQNYVSAQSIIQVDK